MERLFLIVLTVFYHLHLIGQKPVLTSDVCSRWPQIGGYEISNDGEYVLYGIKNKPAGNNTLIIQSVNKKWKMEVEGAEYGLFTPDNQVAVFKKSIDSLGVVTLTKKVVEYIPNVGSFNLSSMGDVGWLIYEQVKPSKQLIVRNLRTKKEISFSSVVSYYYNNNSLIILTESEIKGAEFKDIKLVTLKDNIVKDIWKTSQNKTIRNFVFDAHNEQLVFSEAGLENGVPEQSICYYKIGELKASRIITNSMLREKKMVFENIQRFSKDGKRLFVMLEEVNATSNNLSAVRVNVWRYSDTTLQSYQLKNKAPRQFLSVIDLESKKIIRLEGDNEMLEEPFSGDRGTDDKALISAVRKWGGSLDASESFWNPANQQPVYLISTKDGQRKRLKELEGFCRKSRYLSPTGKYIVYYDCDEKNYFSYEVATGVIRNITSGINSNWAPFGELDPGSLSYSSYPPAGWLRNDSAILLYDQYDIWQVDPTCLLKPINITNSFGRLHNIEFRLMDENVKSFIDFNEKLLLIAYNRKTKKNGFFSKRLRDQGDPNLLTMGPYLYYLPNIRTDIHGASPVKAKNADAYIVQRMSATEAPNLFITKDFKDFTSLSEVKPEGDYNWLTTELHSWKSLDGNELQGVLFKPENFDQKKKYPVIFYCYETVSDLLNAYIMPAVLDNGCAINIPSYVSNGYLVFTPDIRYKIGETGESALNSVVSAAKYLSALSFVDSNRLGLQGCSFGGFETNYIVTHSNVFAAACSVSGISNFVSGYGSLDGDNGSSNQAIYEYGQFRIGATLWDKPELYIKNSPIFQADKVTTPLLIMHTKNDSRCPFGNALELFIGLRRLQKKTWLLEYEDGNHGIFNQAAEDFSLRMSQFFDHYLKHLPPPKWMTNGIPAKLKSISMALELDSNEIVP